ncbi:MAG TPA: secretin N-terminal domain-containing protein [Candidatus Elarobacter sp.]|jgi:type II secretory pathway component GspD/PulD (secretin)|nr:secretin N-terminal domain-containing protein [Candidatus Elarobacter sp.]
MRRLTIAVLTALICTATFAGTPASAQSERFTLDAHDADLADVIRLLGARSGRNVVADGSVKAQRVTLRLKDVTFDEALATLTIAYGLRAHRDARVVFVGEAASMLRRFPDDDGGGRGTESIPLRNVRASEAVKSLRTAVPDGTLLAEDRRNAVLVGGGEDVRSAVRGLLRDLDAPSRQVMIEVRVADVQPLNDTTNVGVQFGGPGYGSGALGQFPYALTKSAITVNAQIDALVQHGHASILAQPRIATLNNREASLLIGEQYPVVTVNQQTGFPSVQTIDVGVRLRLTPTIGADGTITADLHPEYSQIIGFNNSFPIVANRKVDATLRVRDGETIVLGGLFQDVDSETVTKFPVLGDLPVLGGFFRNRQTTHTKDEVVFFITPHVLATEEAR